MKRMTFAAVCVVTALLLTSGLPRQAAAQDAASPGAPRQVSQLKVERVQSGFVIAPDVRFTELDGDFANLVGGYGGWMTDRTLVIGAGGYWLTNRADDFKMAYGGAVIGWLVRGDRRIGFGARALIGGGSATISSTLGDLFDVRGPVMVDLARFGSTHGGRRPGHGPGQPLSSDTRVIVDEDFFVAEPQANVLWNVTSWMQLDVGVGYRLVAGAGEVDDDLRGVSGAIAVQFGGS